MEKRFIVSLVFALVGFLVFFGEASYAMGTAPEEALPSPDQASEATAEKEAQDPAEVIAARVNGKEITMESLIREMNRKVKMLRSGKAPSTEETAQMRKDSLDTLIFIELAAQYGEKNIKVSDDELDDAVKKLRAEFNSNQQFNDYMIKNEYTNESLRKEAARRLTIQKAFQQEVDSKVVYGEEEAQKEYEEEKEIFTIPYRIEVDYISIDAGEDKEAAKKRADEISAELKEAGSTELLQDRTDIRLNTVRITKEQSPELFSRVSALEPSDVSAVFEKDDDLNLMFVRTKIPEELIPFDKAKKWLVERAKKRRALEWFEDLKKDAKLEILLDRSSHNIENETSGETSR